MLEFDLMKIGERFCSLRKRCALTQAEVAERADISERSYADIERGQTNMRLETLMKICQALGVTPDAVLVKNEGELSMMEKLNRCGDRERKTAMDLLTVYLDSLKQR